MDSNGGGPVDVGGPTAWFQVVRFVEQPLGPGPLSDGRCLSRRLQLGARWIEETVTRSDGTGLPVMWDDEVTYGLHEGDGEAPGVALRHEEMRAWEAFQSAARLGAGRVRPGPCPLCRVAAVLPLVATLQGGPDGTTHLCHPVLGGCGRGLRANVGARPLQ